MELFILRHGEAVEASTVGGKDAARHLTESGSQRVRRAAEGLNHLDIQPDSIWTSPLVRAQQTTEITAEVLNCTDRVEEVAILRAGTHSDAIVGAIRERFNGDRLMLVGHNPDFEQLIEWCIADGQARVKMRKGSVAWVRIDAPIRQGKGVLRELWSAETLERIGSR